MLKYTIKSNVRELMEDKGITYVQLEQLTGLSNQTIARARGELIRECKLSTLELIAKGLNVYLKELFYDESDGENKINLVD